jgi:hypothetical protein
MNFSNKQQFFRLPDVPGIFQVVLNSYAEKWNGPGAENLPGTMINEEAQSIKLQPESIIIFATDV